MQTEYRKKPYIIDHIEAAIVSVLNKDGIRYRGGDRGKIKNHNQHSENSLKHLSS